MIRPIIFAALTLSTWAAGSLLPPSDTEPAATEAAFMSEQSLLEEGSSEASLLQEFSALRAASAAEPQDQAPARGRSFYAELATQDRGDVSDSHAVELDELRQVIDQLEAENAELRNLAEEHAALARDLELQEHDMQRAIERSMIEAERQLMALERETENAEHEWMREAEMAQREADRALEELEREMCREQENAEREQEHAEREFEMAMREAEREIEEAMREMEREMENMEREFERAEREFERAEREWDRSAEAWEESECAEEVCEDELWEEREAPEAGGFFSRDPESGLPTSFHASTPANTAIMERLERIERAIESSSKGGGCCCCCCGKGKSKQSVGYRTVTVPKVARVAASGVPARGLYSTGSSSSPFAVIAPAAPAAPAAPKAPTAPLAPAAPMAPCAPAPSYPPVKACAPAAGSSAGSCDAPATSGVTYSFPASGASSLPSTGSVSFSSSSSTSSFPSAATTVSYSGLSGLDDEAFSAEIEALIADMAREVRDLKIVIKELRGSTDELR